MIIKRHFKDGHHNFIEVVTECDRYLLQRYGAGDLQRLLLYKNDKLVDEQLLDYPCRVFITDQGKTIDVIKVRDDEYTGPKTAPGFRTVRAKMEVVNLDEEAREVVLTTLYDASLPEDRAFCQATPWGEIRMGIDNPPALEFFNHGAAFYVDFSIAAPRENYKNNPAV